MGGGAREVAMKVKEVAELVGVSVRTLHYYDKIGLLKPSETTEAGYRLYSQKNIELLQQILFFRALDFPLKEIKKIIHSPSFDQKEALKLQRKMLLEKRDHYDQMIQTIDKTIKHMMGEIKMTNEERFKGVNFKHNPYEEEARKLWGDEAVDQSNAKLNNLSDKERKVLAEKWEGIFTKLASLRHHDPKSKEAQDGIKEWFEFLNSSVHHYSPGAFAVLGELYVQDERFTKNIDQYGEGLAKFMSEAMKTFAERERNMN